GLHVPFGGQGVECGQFVPVGRVLHEKNRLSLRRVGQAYDVYFGLHRFGSDDHWRRAVEFQSTARWRPKRAEHDVVWREAGTRCGDVNMCYPARSNDNWCDPKK